MEENELTEDEREMVEWARSWDVKPVVSDEGTMDMVVTMTRPPWITEDGDDEENPDEMRVTYGTEMPPLLWEAMPELAHEQAFAMMRSKAWADIIAPHLTGGDGS